MNFISDTYLKNHDIIYNSLTNISNKDYDDFQNLFLKPNSNNIIEFDKLINPKDISISKKESNITMMNNLFSELLSLFPNNDINNINILNDDNNNYDNKTENIKIEFDEKKENINKIEEQNVTKNKKSKLLIKKRGRNHSSTKNMNSGTHNRNAQDNMMRKIKNKVIESAYRLINDIYKNENHSNLIIPSKKKEQSQLCKIAGIYSQELHLTFNLWFILQKLKDIFCFKISKYYKNKNPNTNKEIINKIYNTDDDKFINSKKILEMTFFEYYHEIFLNEDNEILKKYGISKNDYNFKSYINKIINDINEDNIKNNIKEDNFDNVDYRGKIENLAKNYENYFLGKFGRNSNKIEKKNDDIIENVINNYKCDDLKKEVIEIIEKYNLKKKIIKNK